MRHSSANGNNQGEPSATTPASTQDRNARSANVDPIAHRRPCRHRSSNGPTSGASNTNGAIVVMRNNATWPRACPSGSAKIVLASDTVNAASPADANTCISVTRLSPDASAPCDRAKPWNFPVPTLAPRPTNLAPATTPLAVALLVTAVACPATRPARAVARPVAAAARRARSAATSMRAG